MEVNGLGIEVHQPTKNPNRGRGLAPPAPWPVFSVAQYDDGRLPREWERGGPGKGAFFLGTHSNRELWFNFRRMNSHSHYVAVMVSIQGMSGVTGQPIPEGQIRMEQYRTHCPLHGIEFGSDRFCRECGFKWPHQNYITNAAGDESVRDFWTDGWRTADGKIRQYVFSLAGEGLGVAEQVLGEQRALAIGFAVFLSKEPKPVETHHRRRGGYFGDGLGLELESSGGGAHTYGGSTMRSFNAGPTLRRVGAPARVEVSFGREVEQEVYRDPHDLDFWREEPEAIFVITPTDNAWVQEITRNGPTVDLTAQGKGPLLGLKGVGNDI